MTTISARTFLYSRRDDDTHRTIYHFVDRRRSDRGWTLVHWTDTPLWEACKIDRTRSTAVSWARRVALPTKLKHAMMASLVRHRRLMASDE